VDLPWRFRLLESDDFVPTLYDEVGLLYAEGYRAFNADCFKKAFSLAKLLEVETALDFSSFGVVEACRKTLDELFEQKMVDIIIANEDEAFAYAGVKEEAALKCCEEGESRCRENWQARSPDCQGRPGDARSGGPCQGH
jgi:hypothetical protein